MTTPEEVLQDACRWAASSDIQYHKQFHVDLNPFSTPGARSMWQRGFDGAPARSYEGTLDLDPIYQRGRACAKLMKEASNVEHSAAQLNSPYRLKP